MKLLDQVREVMRGQHLAYRTEQTCIRWIERYIRHFRTEQGLATPLDDGRVEIEALLTHLAVQGCDSASTQNQALSALLYLCRYVLKIETDALDAVRAQRSRRMPRSGRDTPSFFPSFLHEVLPWPSRLLRGILI